MDKLNRKSVVIDMMQQIKEILRKKVVNQGKTHRAFTLTELTIVFAVTGFIMGSIWYAASAAYDARKSSQAIDEIRFIVDKIHDLEIVNPSIITLKTDPGCVVGSKLCPTPLCVAPYVPPGPPPPPAAPACAGTTPPCGSPCTDRSAGCVMGSITTSNTEYNNLYGATGISAGLFPTEMVNGTTISSPWGRGDVNLNISQTTNGCAANASLATSVWSTLMPGQSTNIQTQPGYTPASTYTAPTTVSLVINDVPPGGCTRLISDYGVELLNMGLTSFTTVGSGGTYGDSNLTPAKASDFTTSNATYWCKSPTSSKITMTFVFSTQTPN